MEVLLDSSFIVSCIRKRIDFLDQLQEQGFTVKVPREVLQELKDLKKKKTTSRDDRVAIDVAFEMIEQRKVKKMTIGQQSVDDALIQRGNEGYYIATLDAGIKNKIPQVVGILAAQARVGIL